MANEKRNLIDRDDLIDSLGVSDMEIFAKEVIGDAPTVDAVEVVRGWWVEIPSLMDLPWKKYRCNHCGCPQDYKHNYCPNCGADMRERKDNGM